MKVKQVFFGLVVIAAILFTGCSGSEIIGNTDSPNAVDKLYTAESEITVTDENGEEFDYSGVLTRKGGGMWEMDITSPETVKGLKITLDDSGINASLGDLNFNLEADKIPSKNSFLKIFSVLDNIAANKNNLKMTETENDLCYKGELNGESYTLLCDKVNNNPCGLKLPEINVLFISFTVTGEAAENSESTQTTQSSAETSVSVNLETSEVTAVPEETKTEATSTVTATETVSQTTVTSENAVMTTPMFTTSVSETTSGE